MKPRITVCLVADGSFEILLNEAGRALLIQHLQCLDCAHDHFHLDHHEDVGLAEAAEVPLCSIPYRAGDQVLEHGKVLFRPDDWDREFFPHVFGGSSPSRG